MCPRRLSSRTKARILVVLLSLFIAASLSLGMDVLPESRSPSRDPDEARSISQLEAPVAAQAGLIDTRRRMIAADFVASQEAYDVASHLLEGLNWLQHTLLALRIFADLSHLVAMASTISIGLLLAVHLRSRGRGVDSPRWLPYSSFLALTLAIFLALWHLDAWPRAMLGYSPESGLPTTELIYTALFQVVFFSMGAGLVTCYVVAPYLKSRPGRAVVVEVHQE